MRNKKNKTIKDDNNSVETIEENMSITSEENISNINKEDIKQNQTQKELILSDYQDIVDESDDTNNIHEVEEVVNADKTQENAEQTEVSTDEDSDINSKKDETSSQGSEKTHRHYLIAKEKEKKKVKLFLIISLIIVVNFIIIFGIISALNRLNTNVYKNIFVFGQDISNYSSEQVVRFLEDKSNMINEQFNIDVYQGDKVIYDIKYDDIDFSIDIEKTSNKIMAFGRKDNFILDNIKILKALILKKEIIPEYTYSDEKLDGIIKNIDLTIEDRYADDAYSVDESKNVLTIIRGKTGNSINSDIMKQDIINIIKDFKSSNYTIDIITKKPESIDMEELYNSITRDPEDAYIDTTSKPPKFVNEVNGYDIDMKKLTDALDKEKNKKEGASIEFSLTVIEPKVKLTDLTYTLYNDKLAGYTTYFDSSQKTRAKNLEIALKYLNGAIVMPGKTFSYYGRVGEITAAKGYLPAATFKGGTVVYETGGGICQTSSTLYNVALMANMEIVERHQHGLPVAYVPPSRDATIYGNILDFKFKNTRNYPVKIVTSFSPSGSMNISIYGTKEKEEYVITLSSKVLYYIPYTTKYTYDKYVNAGTTSVTSKGVNGYASESYITKKLNGVVVSSKLLSKDVYKAQQEVVKVGTKVKTEKEVDIY